MARGSRSSEKSRELDKSFSSSELSRRIVFTVSGVDSGIGVGGNQVKTDLAFTLFLSDPSSYVAGDLGVELQSHNGIGELPEDELFLYPTSLIHAVSEVTNGTRIACVGWIESRMRSDSVRTKLFDLANIRVNIAAKLGEIQKNFCCSPSLRPI